MASSSTTTPRSSQCSGVGCSHEPRLPLTATNGRISPAADGLPSTIADGRLSPATTNGPTHDAAAYGAANGTTNGTTYGATNGAADGLPSVTTYGNGSANGTANGAANGLPLTTTYGNAAYGSAHGNGNVAASIPQQPQACCRREHWMTRTPWTPRTPQEAQEAQETQEI